MTRLAAGCVLLFCLSAAAQVPTISSGSRVHDGPAAYLIGGSDTFGLGAGVGFWAGELGYRPWASSLSLRVSREYQLIEDGPFAVAAQLAGALNATTGTAFDLG